MSNNRVGNTLNVIFKDGTDYNSSGSSSGKEKFNLLEDLKFIATSFGNTLIDMGKTLEDVDQITIDLKRSKNES